jgi:HlyD family secretion protein
MATDPSEMTTQNPPWDAKKSVNSKYCIRRFLPLLGLLVVVGLIIWGLQPKAVLVETGLALRGPLTVKISEEGKTRVKNRYVVAAPISGKMRRIMLKPGDAVTASTTLLTVIEPITSPLLDPRARMQAEVAVSLQEAARKLAAETLLAKRAAAQIAMTERERMRAVVRVGSISDSERDRVEGDATIKATEVRAAEFSLQVSDYELAQSRAVLIRPDGVIADNIYELRAPITGRILKVMQESEMVVTAGMPILELGDPMDLEIEAEILSRDAVAIRPGDLVDVEQWGGEIPLKACVRRIEPAAFTKISALGVEEQRVLVLSDVVDLPESAKVLGDRYRVEVRVAIWHNEDTLTVPAGALFREGNVWKTYRFRGGKAVLVELEVGHSDGRHTEILAGLDANDEVLLHPPDIIKDGTRVSKK